MFSENQIKEMAIAEINEKVPAMAEDKTLEVVEGAESGTVVDVLGLDSEGGLVKGSAPAELPATTGASAGNALLLDSDKKPVWGAVSGGTKLYLHHLAITPNGQLNSINIDVITTGTTSFIVSGGPPKPFTTDRIVNAHERSNNSVVAYDKQSIVSVLQYDSTTATWSSVDLISATISSQSHEEL